MVMGSEVGRSPVVHSSLWTLTSIPILPTFPSAQFRSQSIAKATFWHRLQPLSPTAVGHWDGGRGNDRTFMVNVSLESTWGSQREVTHYKSSSSLPPPTVIYWPPLTIASFPAHSSSLLLASTYHHQYFVSLLHYSQSQQFLWRIFVAGSTNHFPRYPRFM